MLESLSFRTKREIRLRSLAFARDDRPLACHFAPLRLGGRSSGPGFIRAPLVRARDLMAEPLFTVIAARLQHRQANFQGRLAPLAIVRHGLV